MSVLLSKRPVALITGASRGIGRAIATQLAPTHDLVITGRHEPSLANAAIPLRAQGASVIMFTGDLGIVDARDLLVQQLRSLDTPITILINNAGIADSMPLHRTEDPRWNNTIELNLSAPFTLIRALAPAMIEQQWGRIINIASTAALKGYRYTAAYSASKAGLLGLTRALAAELGPKGITVNAICPGFTETDITANAIHKITSTTGRSEAQARASLEQFSPLGRLVAPDEVAHLVAYLVSTHAAAINGQALAIDGGETSQ